MHGEERKRISAIGFLADGICLTLELYKAAKKFTKEEMADYHRNYVDPHVGLSC